MSKEKQVKKPVIVKEGKNVTVKINCLHVKPRIIKDGDK